MWPVLIFVILGLHLQGDVTRWAKLTQVIASLARKCCGPVVCVADQNLPILEGGELQSMIGGDMRIT